MLAHRSTKHRRLRKPCTYRSVTYFFLTLPTSLSHFPTYELKLNVNH